MSQSKQQSSRKRKFTYAFQRCYFMKHDEQCALWHQQLVVQFVYHEGSVQLRETTCASLNYTANRCTLINYSEAI